MFKRLVNVCVCTSLVVTNIREFIVHVLVSKQHIAIVTITNTNSAAIFIPHSTTGIFISPTTPYKDKKP